MWRSTCRAVGLTNNGELESSREYSGKQVLAFLRKVAEERVIEKPK